jgi:hypothetical protein
MKEGLMIKRRLLKGRSSYNENTLRHWRAARERNFASGITSKPAFPKQLFPSRLEMLG